MHNLRIELDVEVQPKGRPRTVQLKKPRFSSSGKLITSATYTPKKTKNNQILIGYMLKKWMKANGVKQIPKDVPLKVTFEIYIKKKFGSCDIDNLYKTVADSANTIIWHDDSQVVSFGESHVKFDSKSPKLILIIEPAGDYTGDLFGGCLC